MPGTITVCARLTIESRDRTCRSRCHDLTRGSWLQTRTSYGRRPCASRTRANTSQGVVRSPSTTPSKAITATRWFVQTGDGWMVAMGVLESERGVSTLGQQMHFAHELDLVIEAARANGKISDPMTRQRIMQAWSGLRVMRYNALRMLSGEATRLNREALIYKYYWSNWHRELGKLAADVLGTAADVVSGHPAIRRLQQVFFFSRAETSFE